MASKLPERSDGEMRFSGRPHSQLPVPAPASLSTARTRRPRNNTRAPRSDGRSTAKEPEQSDTGRSSPRSAFFRHFQGCLCGRQSCLQDQPSFSPCALPLEKKSAFRGRRFNESRSLENGNPATSARLHMFGDGRLLRDFPVTVPHERQTAVCAPPRERPCVPRGGTYFFLACERAISTASLNRS